MVSASVDPESAPGSVPPSAESSRGRLVVLGPEGRPVAGARVESLEIQIGTGPFTPDPPTPVPLGATDDEGRFPWPPEGLEFPTILRAVHPGLAPGETLAATGDGETVLRLERGGVLEGVVVDAAGIPVAGAGVSLTAVPVRNLLGPGLGVTGSWSRTARTGSDGRFRLDGLPAIMGGLLAAEAAGYAGATVAWKSGAPESVQLVLEPSFRSEVLVVDGAGTPLDGAAVRVFGGPRLEVSPWLQPWPAVLPLPRTGPGTYAREDLPPGWCSVLVARPGYRLVVEEGAAFGADLPAVRVALEPTPGIGGRVVRSDTKEPVAGIRVRASLRKRGLDATGTEADPWDWPLTRMEGPFAAVTAADGTYRLPVLGPEDDFVVTATDGDGSWGMTVHRGKPGPLGGGEAQVGDLWLTKMLREVVYTGRVLSRAGDPIPGALVDGITTRTVSGADGRFLLEGRTGLAGIQVLAPGFLPRRVPAPGADPRGGGFGAQEFGDVGLAPFREIRGTVVDREGAPVAGIPLWALPVGKLDLPRGTDFGGGAGVADAEGRVAITVVPGHSYTVKPFDPERMGTVEVSGDAAEPFRLVVGPDPAAGRGRILGRLLLEDGTWTPSRVKVALRSERGGSSGGIAAEAAPDGSFVLEGVPAGNWGLRVSGSDAVAGETGGIVLGVGGTVRVDVPCVRLLAEDAGEGTIRVRPEPVAAEGTELRGFLTGPGSAASVPLGASADGTFSAKVKGAGPFRAWLMDAGGLRAGVATDLAPDAAEPAAVRLVPAGVLHLPGWEFGTAEPRVEVRDGAGARIFSGGYAALPVIPGRGYVLVLQAGAWHVEVTTGGEGGTTRSHEATVEAGREKGLGEK